MVPNPNKVKILFLTNPNYGEVGLLVGELKQLGNFQALEKARGTTTIKKIKQAKYNKRYSYEGQCCKRAKKTAAD
uniref:Uncharacterized protein n=1 Tax=Moorena producens (strain JHB) TaxID=1454205 RepID=A0A1D9G2A0_MOOP1